MEKIKVSVISLASRPGFIDTLVDSLMLQTMNQDEWELILVDDLADRRKEKVAEYMSGRIKNFLHIPPRHVVPYSASSAAHNSGLIHARGELVYSTADRLYAHPRCLERHWQIYSKYGPNVIISGPFVDLGIDYRKDNEKLTDKNAISILKDPIKEAFIADWSKRPIDWRTKATCSLPVDKNLYENKNYADQPNCGCWWWCGVNDSAPLHALVAINGLDEAFNGRRGGNDGDFGSRLVSYGCKYLIDTEAPCAKLPGTIKKPNVFSEEERNRRVVEKRKHQRVIFAPNDYNLRQEREKIGLHTKEPNNFDTSITVIHIGPLELLKKCVASIKENTIMPYQLVIVVDKPDIATKEYLVAISKKGADKVAINPELVGAEQAQNQALQMADGKYLSIVNTGVELSPAAIESMREILERYPEFGWVALSSEFTGFLTGCSMMTREAFTKLGLFDTQFSTAFNDDDYMRRMWKAGYKPHIVTGVKVSHKDGEATIDKRERFIKSQQLFHQRYGEWGTNWDTLPKVNFFGKEEALMKEQVKKLNIGSFTVMMPSPEWLNLDIIDLSAYAEEKGFKFQQVDVTKGLPHKDNSVDFINSSHLIEHLTVDEGIAFLKECWRVLKPNSTIRLGTPDVNKLIDAYKNNEMDKFNDTQPEEYKQAPSQADKFWRIFTAGHKTCYDLPAIKHSLELAGFEAIQQSDYNKELDKFPEVSLYIEAKKPAYVAEKMPTPQSEGIPEYWKRFATEKRIKEAKL